jgi:hypothetical protein
MRYRTRKLSFLASSIVISHRDVLLLHIFGKERAALKATGQNILGKVGITTFRARS